MANLTAHTGSSTVRKLSRRINLSEGVQDVSITADVTITAENANILRITGDTSNRSLTADVDIEEEGAWQMVVNAGATNSLLWKSSAAATIVTIPFGGAALVYYTGAAWRATQFPAVGSSGAFSLGDSVPLNFGDASDIVMQWNGTKFVVTQATANSAIDLGVDGAGIDLILRGDTAGAAATWDQDADSFILSGVAKIKLQTIAAATGTAIPVTHSGSFPVTTAAAETNTLAIPTFLGQTLTIFVDTYAGGDRVITSAQRINQAGNTVITLGAVGDFIKLEAITIGGALRWQVIANDGAALS